MRTKKAVRGKFRVSMLLRPHKPRHGYVVCLLAMALAFVGGEATSQNVARPKPPTSLRIEGAPVSEALDRNFAREGISKIVRTEILDSLKKLEDSDLVALAKELSPQDIALVRPDEISVSQWGRLVASYADAVIADRRMLSGVLTQTLMTVFSVLLTAVISIPVGMWLERRKKPAPNDAAS